MWIANTTIDRHFDIIFDLVRPSRSFIPRRRSQFGSIHSCFNKQISPFVIYESPVISATSNMPLATCGNVHFCIVILANNYVHSNFHLNNCTTLSEAHTGTHTHTHTGTHIHTPDYTSFHCCAYREEDRITTAAAFSRFICCLMHVRCDCH